MNPFVPYLLLFIPFMLEGVGVNISRYILLLYYLILPFLLIVLNRQNKYLLPPRLTFFSLLFLFFSNISFFFFSLDKQVSFEYFLLSFSLFFIFIYIYNHKSSAEKYIPLVIAVLGIIFIAYSLLLPTLKHLGFNFFVPSNEKQVVFPTYSPHNHLGDFLGLLLLLLLVKNMHKQPMLLIVSFFSVFYFFFISFSRSAYLAFFLVFLLFLLQQYRKIGRTYLLIGLISLDALLIIFFISSSKGIINPSSIPLLHPPANQTISIIPRNLFSGHDLYAYQAIVSIQKKPLFGVGGGNYLLAVLGNNMTGGFSDSAHNLILDVTAENGIPAGICIFIIGCLLLIYVIKKPSLSGYLFVYLVLNFQTDYTYQIYLFLVFAVILAASFYRESDEISISGILFGCGTLIPLFISLLFVISAVYVSKNKPFEALTYYPLNKEAYIQAIKQTKGDEKIIKKALSIAPYDINIVLISSEMYLKNKQKQKALALYEKAYEANHQISFSVMKQIYFLKKEYRTKQDAQHFLAEIIQTIKQNFISDLFRSDVNVFCEKAGKIACKEVGWK